MEKNIIVCWNKDSAKSICDKAKESYDLVVNNFPNTQSAQAAQTKLAEINNSGN